MNTIRRLIFAASALLFFFASAAQSLAVEGQALQIQGTNLVLSWPSPGGYQEYLIQYRQTLDPSMPWTELTNNYFANGTEFTTYTITGVVPPQPAVSGGGSTNLVAPPEPMSATPAEPTEPMAVRADGTGPIVPLAIYPPCFDLSGFLIYDPAGSNWVSGSEYTRPALSINNPRGPQPQHDPLEGATRRAPVFIASSTSPTGPST